MGIKSADLKDNFCSRVLQLSELPRRRERPQTAMCYLEWLGRLKGLATGLDVSVISFYIGKVFSESDTYLSSCFTNV